MISFDVQSGKWESATLEFKFSTRYLSGLSEQQKESANKQLSYILKNFGQALYLGSNKIYYCGGGPCNQSYILQFQSKTGVVVSPLPPMLGKRCWHQVLLLHKQTIYVLGGFDGAQRLKSCEKIDINLTNSKYESVAPMNEGRCLFASCLVESQNKIYVFGGSVGSGQMNSDSIEVYNQPLDTWRKLLVKLPQKIQGLSAICLEAHPQKIFLFGGSTGCNKDLQQKVYAYDTAEEQITQIKKMKEKRQLNNKIFQDAEGSVLLLGGNFQLTQEKYTIPQYEYLLESASKVSALEQQLNDYYEQKSRPTKPTETDLPEPQPSYGAVVKNDLSIFAGLSTL